ncbi:autotransporter domain-containing protein [Sutterella megalosphaeroides]|uniref:Autotransporter domain-containing protein n=1 Tax=Sutterella megalosphaeroides TaxID=2494234 RepID=A0A2Z6IBU2_9BURK|nr:autotransporter domain-containing protein [Sutterella megalosphaeroides]BBF23370.1 hypothetical protein SUTMEG_12610 [Sutterella megalosphaeroides]
MKSQSPHFTVAALARALAAALAFSTGAASAGPVMVIPESTSGNDVVLKNTEYVLNGVATPVTWSYDTVAGGYSDGGATVSNNTVTVNDPEMVKSGIGYLYGGYGKSGLVTGNRLVVDGSYRGGNGSLGVSFILRGSFSESGDVVGNSLELKRMRLAAYGTTVGHESQTGRVADNTVLLQSVVLNREPTYLGVRTYSGSAERNTLILRGYKSPYGGSGSELPTRIDRAYAASAGNLAVGNRAYLEDWSYVNEFGAAIVDSGLAEDNEVHLTGEHVRVQRVFGVQAQLDSIARGNSVFLESGPRLDDADAAYFLPYGSLTGAQTDTGDAVSNRVVVTGGAVGGDVYGARSNSGTVTSNVVRMADDEGIHSGFFVGGLSTEGTAAKNRVVIEGGTLTGTLAGGQTASGTATGNVVEMKGGTFTGDIYGGHAVLDGTVSENIVEISGGKVIGNVYARFVNYGLDGTADHSSSVGNRIVLKGSEAGMPDLSKARLIASNVPVPVAPPPGDCSADGSCTDGVTEVPVEEPIPGEPPVEAAALLRKAPSLRETVFSSGGTLEIDGFSGSVLSVADFERIDFTNVVYTDASADRPILTILDADASRTDDTLVSVSRITLDGSADLTNLKTLKLLEIVDAPDIAFKYDESKVFDIYQGVGVIAQGSLVASPSGGVDVGEPNVTPDPNPGDGDSGDNSGGNPGGGDSGEGGTENPDDGNDNSGNGGDSGDNPGENPGGGDSGDGGTENPDDGNDNSDNGSDSGDNPGENPGVDDSGDGDTENPDDGSDNSGNGGDSGDNSGGIDVDIDNARVNPQMRLVARTRAASVAFANTGAELVSEKLSALRSETREGGHFFGGIYGKREKFDVASNLDIKGYSAIVGAGWRSRTSFADVTGALFYEHGKGDYTTENTFAGQSFDGTGSLRTNGGGAALRLDFENGTHASASIRIGDLNTTMDNVLMDGMDRAWGYEVSSTYYGLTTEIGHEWALSHALRLEGYAAYGYTYVDSADFSIGNEKFEFASVSSHRLKAGARVHYAVNEASRITAGLSYEQELDGKTTLRVGSLEAPAENIKGGTVGAEAGFSFTPSSASNWTIDATARAFAGERQGISGTFQSTWRF